MKAKAKISSQFPHARTRRPHALHAWRANHLRHPQHALHGRHEKHALHSLHYMHYVRGENLRASCAIHPEQLADRHYRPRLQGARRPEALAEWGGKTWHMALQTSARHLAGIAAGRPNGPDLRIEVTPTERPNAIGACRLCTYAPLCASPDAPWRRAGLDSAPIRTRLDICMACTVQLIAHVAP